MRISVENASPDFSRAVNDIPPIDTQRAVTTVLVGDGETTVIGGIYVSREQTVAGPHAAAVSRCRCSAGCSSATTSATRAANC